MDKQYYQENSSKGCGAVIEVPGAKGYFRCIRISKMRPECEVRDASERLMKPLGEDCANSWPTEQRERDKTENRGKGN